MKKRLWNYFDGEPFLDNPYLGILNAKKGKRTMATRRKRGRKATRRVARRPVRRTSTRRRTHRARRNPYPMAGLVVNPRRRRRTRAVSRRRTRRSSYRRNPALLGFSIPPLSKVLFAGVGFFAPPVLEGMISNFLPASISGTTLGKYATRILSVVGLTYAVRKFVGVEESNMVAIGGSVYVVSTALREFAPGIIPGLGMYVPARRGLGEYVGATGLISMPIVSQSSLPGQQTPSRFLRSTR